MQQAGKSRAKRLAVAQKRVSEHDRKHQVRARVLGEEHACEMMLDQRPTEPDGDCRYDRRSEHGARAPRAADRRCQETRERNKREPCAEQGLMEPLDDRDMRRNCEYDRQHDGDAPRGLATRSALHFVLRSATCNAKLLSELKIPMLSRSSSFSLKP